MRSLLLGAAMTALLAFPAAARDFHHAPPNDEIVLQLRSEAWVETGTAKVVAIVETVLPGNQAAQQDRSAPPVLKDLAPNADWRIVSFDRSRDASGLERLRIVAEARLADSAIGGIYDRAREISKPGTQVTVSNIEFAPTLAEREATASRLRAEIYRQAADELARVSEVWPDRGFRVQRVDFATGPTPPPRPMPKMARGMAAAAPEAVQSMAYDAAGGASVSERMVLSATVVIAAPGVEPADGAEKK